MVDVKADVERKISAAIKRVAELSEVKKVAKKEETPLKKYIKEFLDARNEDGMKTSHGYVATVRHEERRYVNVERVAADLGITIDEFDAKYKDPKPVTVLTCRKVA